jgi:hypothetical protein
MSKYLEERASLESFYWEFVKTYNPEACQNFGRNPLNYFLLITKYSQDGQPIGTSGPCVAVSIAGISTFNGERETWDFVSPNDQTTLRALSDHENLGLVQLGQDLRRYLEQNNIFIGLPPEFIQKAIDDGLAVRIRE